MKTEQLFNQKQTIDISGLSRDKIRHLYKYQLLDRPQKPVRFSLTEVIYCRSIFWLKECYSSQQVKDFIFPCKKYENELISKDYIFIEFLGKTLIQLISEDYLSKPIKRKIKDTYIYNYKEIKLTKNKDLDSVYSNYCYVNLKSIRTELIERARKYNLDSIDRKFEPFLDYKRFAYNS